MRPPYDPSRLKIERKRFSTTQGEVALTYDGVFIQQFGDRITLRDGQYRGYDDAFWHEVARRELGYDEIYARLKAEFPDYDDLAALPRQLPTGFHDSSHAPDGFPTLTDDSWPRQNGPSPIGYRIELDYRDVANRIDNVAGPRFVLSQMHDDEDWRTIAANDDLAVVLSAFRPAAGHPLVVALADAFVARLRTALDDDAFAQVRAENTLRIIRGEPSCASHDAIDPNPLMACAFQAVFGHEPYRASDLQDPLREALIEVDNAWMNASWDLARETELSFPRPLPADVVEAAIDAAVRIVQVHLGVATGDLAAQFWTGGSENGHVAAALQAYARTELAHRASAETRAATPPEPVDPAVERINRFHDEHGAAWGVIVYSGKDREKHDGELYTTWYAARDGRARRYDEDQIDGLPASIAVWDRNGAFWSYDF
jgi:hypothetical protein